MSEPTAKPRHHGPGQCPECGAIFTRTHHHQIFCSAEHKAAHHRRAKQRGQTVATLLQAHRLARHTKDPKLKAAGAQAFKTYCALADRWNAEDKEAGRLSALKLMVRQSAHGFRDPL